MFDSDDLSFVAIMLPNPRSLIGALTILAILIGCTILVLHNEEKCEAVSKCVSPARSELIEGRCVCVSDDVQPK